MRRGLPVVAFAALLAACGTDRPDPPCCAVPIEVALASAPHVLSVQEQATSVAGYRLFWLDIEQPLDHAAPGGPAFRQFASLLYRGPGRPVVLATNGYGASRLPGRSELAALLDASQLTVEHRFFGSSTPSPPDWSKLTIQQAAADHHRVVESLRPVLGGRWLSAGASKGGMTAVYHRRFYPADVDGTVAYVAPISTSTSDQAYVAFLQAVGTAGCRQALQDLQHALLARRAEVQPLFEASAGPGDGFTTFGPSKAYDYAVVELSFAFWQYGSGLPACAGVPAPDAGPAALFAFMDGTLGGAAGWIGDRSLAFYAGYYYQSATQLGGPAYPQDHLLDVLPGGVPADDVPEVYPPLGVQKTWDAAAMPDVAGWVSTSGQRLLFVYGENDPWSTRPFAPDAANDSFRFFVPAGNHGSIITLLPDPDRGSATAAVRRWAGLEAAAALSSGEVPAHDPRALLEGERGLSALR